MPLATKTRASKQPFQSLTQITIEGFKTTFAEKLNPKNRWAVLGRLIPTWQGSALFAQPKASSLFRKLANEKQLSKYNSWKLQKQRKRQSLTR